MDIAQLRTFLAAAETGSFAAAAEAVNASPSSVTERIAALENRISARLFERSRKGCELTDAGMRFLPRARSIAAIWEMSRAEARVPPRFTAQARIGGQYALWPNFLQPWIARLQTELPALALNLTAGASARLNRDLAGEVIDLAILYSPTLGPGISARAVLNDRLIMVRAQGCDDWRESWVDIDWGEQMRAPIADVVGDIESNGLRLDLGGMALRWVIERCGAAYVPERLARPELARGSIVPVQDKPSFDYPAYALWRSRTDFDAAPVISSMEDFVASTDALIALT